LQVALNDKDIVKSLSREAIETARIFANDFTRSGVRLPPPQRTGFVRLSSEILSLGRTFVSNVSADGPSVRLSADEIRNSGSGARFLSRSVEVPGNSARAHAILGSAPDENVRRKIYTASKQSSREQLAVLEFLLKARADLAHLVGYSSFAAMTLDDKMAKTPGKFGALCRYVAHTFV
jgi:intermediate peptidase